VISYGVRRESGRLSKSDDFEPGDPLKMLDVARHKGQSLRKCRAGNPAVIVSNMLAGLLQGPRGSRGKPGDVLVDLNDAELCEKIGNDFHLLHTFGQYLVRRFRGLMDVTDYVDDFRAQV